MRDLSKVQYQSNKTHPNLDGRSENTRPPQVTESANSRNISVLIVDDHKLVRQGFRNMIESQDDMIVGGEAENGREAVKLAREIQPDVVLMDFSMPVMNGINATQKITEEQPGPKVIGLSLYEKTVVADKMKAAGAATYLTKTEGVEALCGAIRKQAHLNKTAE